MELRQEAEQKSYRCCRVHLQELSRLSKGSFDFICSQYKTLAKKINYFINYLNLFQPLSDHLALCLSKCMKEVNILVLSTEFEKYGHIFPHFMYVVNKYQRIMNWECGGRNSAALIERTVKNDESQRYSDLKPCSIILNEFQFIRSEKFSPFLTEVISNKIAFDNAQCACCSAIYFRSSKILNSNQLFSPLLQINQKNNFFVECLQKYFCSVLNSGGGVLFIGAEKSKDELIVKGMSFGSANQIKQIQDTIKEALKTIKPEPSYLMELVPVCKKLIDRDGTDKLMLLCIRLQIFPPNQKQLSYIVKSQKQFLVYTLDRKEGKPVEVPFAGDKAYNFMIEKYQRTKFKPNCHANIQCFKNNFTPSQFFLRLEVTNSDGQDDENLEGNPQYEEVGSWLSNFKYQSDIPNFRYQNSSLIVVPTSFYNRYVENFVAYLDKTNISYEIGLPFRIQFEKESMRIIWMISHRLGFHQIQTLLEQFLAKKKMLKKGMIKIMPVQKTLQISNNKQNTKKLETVIIRFKQRYGRSCEYREAVDKNQQKLAYLTFEDFSQAIYAYMLFESLHLRPFFVEDGSTYFKKAK